MAEVTSLKMYFVEATAGGLGLPTGPRKAQLHLQLIVDSPTGKVSGRVFERRGIHTESSIVTGYLMGLTLKKYTRVLALQGTDPERFRAVFAIDGGWTGVGSWTMVGHTTNDAPIRPDNRVRAIGPVVVVPKDHSVEAAVGRHILFQVDGNVWEWTIASSDESVVGELSHGYRDESAEFAPGARALEVGTAHVTLTNSAGRPAWVVEVKVTE